MNLFHTTKNLYQDVETLAPESLSLNETPEILKTKAGKFRIAAKKVFLTFPNMDAPVDDFDIIFEKIKNSSPELASVIIAKELHQNDIPHFHLFIEFTHKFDTENPHHFDYIFNKHGNYSSVRNLKQTIKYITKGNNYKEYISSYTQTKESFTRLIRTSLEDPRCKTHDLYKKEDAAFRDHIFLQANKIEIYHKRYQAYLHEKDLHEKRHIIQWDLPRLEQETTATLKPYIRNLLPILHFLNRHMVKPNRNYKAPHLLIWSSEPNFGKSSLMNLLTEIAPTYLWPSDNWYELYTNYLLQFIIWDEFTLVGHTQEFLKLLFAGGPLKLPIKGSQIFKKDNPLIFCGSNYSLKDHVKRKYSLTCNCYITNNRTLNSEEFPLCLQGSDCTPNRSALLYYDALCARIKEYRLPGPLFPNSTTNEKTWHDLKNLLKSVCVVHKHEGEPQEPQNQIDTKEWNAKMNELIEIAEEPEVALQCKKIFSPVNINPKETKPFS